MLKLIDDGTISGKIAKSVLPKMVEFGRSPLEIVKEAGLTRIASNDAIEQAADKVFKEYPKAVQDALVDERAVNYLVGQLMKLTAGRADPKLANKIVKEKLLKAKKDPAK
jgi:aspartyl-tRNA(Asn)/glutamyl-tRNA(Gln) amidotransferase subunit B